MQIKERALVIYARPPVAGAVKTRLQPHFSAEEALVLYEAMLADLLERAKRAAAGEATLFVSWSSSYEPQGEMIGLLKGCEIEYQVGDDLGERMAATLQARLRGGFKQAVLIGSDAPHFPLDYIHQAFEALLAVDIVLGPCPDGGYYLIGCRRLHPRLFQRMPWGTDQVLSITRRRIKDGGVLHHELPSWYDVDSPADVLRLWTDLQHMKAKGSADLPRRTFRALASLVPGRTGLH